MAADDRIRRTFDALAERLRGEISRQLDEFSGPLSALQASIDDERADRHAEAAAESARLAEAAAAADGRIAAAEVRLAAAIADADERLADAVGAADERVAFAESRLAEAAADTNDRVAAALADAERRHAAAVAQAEIRGRDAARAELRSMELAASERLAEAMRAMDRARSLSDILDTLASCAGREAARVGVLLVRGNHLRAWRFIGFGPLFDEAGQYEMPMADAGIIGDAVRTGLPVSGDSAAHASAPSFAELPPGRETLALPVPMSGQIVAVLYADQGPEAPSLLSWPATLEVMTRHAARCLEAVTAYRAAQVLTERPDMPTVLGGADTVAPHATRSGGQAPVGTVDEEQAAHRYARLLISEIKLYHEADVLIGRRERDLASRLGGEITRARVLYEQRVPAHIRQSTDYFHDELVRTLADGDGALIA